MEKSIEETKGTRCRNESFFSGIRGLFERLCGKRRFCRRNSDRLFFVDWPDGRTVELLHSLNQRDGKPSRNKAGNWVFRGRSGGRDVKLYETHNEAHATFIKKVSSLNPATFPEVLAIQGHCVMAEWVRGQLLDEALPGRNCKEVINSFVRVQIGIHETPSATLPGPNFDYWEDYIMPRFVRVMALLGKTVLAQRVCDSVAEAWGANGPFLLHPDFNPRNSVLDPCGDIKIIDNELLTVGGLVLTDLANTANTLPKPIRRVYLKSYLENGNSTHLADTIEASQSLWFARLIGSCFEKGRFGELHGLIESYSDERNILPLDLTLIRSKR